MIDFIKRNYFRLLISFGTLSGILYSSFTILQNGEKAISLYMIIYASAFILFYLSYLFVIKKADAGSKSVVLIIVFGLLFRLVLIPSSPSTSDDVYRYVWEGKLIVNGFNPFEVAPNDDSLKSLHTKKYPSLVSFPEMTTIYPTIAQVVFAAGYIISGENDIGIKIIYLFAELMTLIFIVLILRQRKLNPSLVILYSWMPLPIMEFFVNSHIDAIGITFFVMFVYLMLTNKYLIASVPFALGVMTKMYPLIFLPLLIKKLGLIKTTIFVAIVSVICISLLYPLIPEEHPVADSLTTYLRNWSFNGSFYAVIYSITGNGYDAKSLVFALMIVSIGNIAIRYKDFLKAVYGVWLCFIMFSATLYPWYLGWIAAINPAIGLASVMSLFFTINITNFTPMADVWTEYWWAYLIQFIPFYIILLYEFRTNIREYFSKRKRT
jgi:alpha-1,6-mannosyltransferase